MENRDRTKSTIYLRKLLSGCVIKSWLRVAVTYSFVLFSEKNV